jgi:hypothetical protein
MLSIVLISMPMTWVDFLPLQEDQRIEKALNVKNVMQTIMRMNKEDLKKTLAEKKDTMEEL